MSRQVIAYPSGFLAYSVGWPVRQSTPDIDAKMAAVRFSKVSAPKERSVISNPIIETLFKQWRDKIRKTSDADFVEDIISAAVQAFGTTNIYEWFHMQSTGPYFTANHRAFLNETLNYIVTGKRQFSHATWMKILRLSLATPEDQKVAYEYDSFFRSTNRRAALFNPSNDVYTFVQRWLALPGGIDDMLTTLHIIFGDSE